MPPVASELYRKCSESSGASVTRLVRIRGGRRPRRRLQLATAPRPVRMPRSDQQPAPELAERDGEEAVKLKPAGISGGVNPEATGSARRTCFSRWYRSPTQSWSKTARMPGQPPHARMSHVEADLEIDQVRASVVADDHVLALVEIDIGDPATVHLAKRRAKRREERRVTRSSLPSGWPAMNDRATALRSRRPSAIDRAERFGNLRQIGKARECAMLALREPPAEPHHRHAEDRLDAVELADDLPGIALRTGPSRPTSRA